jgi:endoglucanase
VGSKKPGDLGSWYGYLMTYMQAQSLDWCYWAVNGTESTGSSRTWGAAETYGILNPSWNGSAMDSLTMSLQQLIQAGSRVSKVQ